MNISDLKTGQGSVEVEAEVTEIEEPRTFNKFGREIRVCNATVKDDSGNVKLTLWNDDIEKVSVGDKIKITNGYVNEFQGEKQLTTGKFGKLEVLGKSESTEAEAKPEAKEEVEKPVEEKVE